jgi:hypothetical protein
VPVTIEETDEFKADLAKSIHKANTITNNEKDSLLAIKKAKALYAKSKLCPCSLQEE